MKTKRLICLPLIFVSLLLSAQIKINPPFSMPDVNVTVRNNVAYAFCGTDLHPEFRYEPEFIMPYWRCFSSTDLINWTLESVLYPTNLYMGNSTKCFAGHGIERNGKWYWYFSDYIHSIGVAVSDSPKGPWKDALGKPLLPPGIIDSGIYDPCAFIDDDGKAYLTFGSHKNKKINYYIVALNDDMISLKEAPRKLIVNDIPEGQDYLAIDASFLFKHDGRYYLSWRKPYAVSKSPYGPYQFVGLQDAIGHGGFFDFHNQNFVNYTSLKEGMRIRYRFSSLAYVDYKKDGSIAPIDPLIKDYGVGQYEASWPKIEAEWFMAMPNGPDKVEKDTKGFEIRNLQNNNYLNFPNINGFPQGGSVELTYSCGQTQGGEVVIRSYNQNGPEIGRAHFAPTSGWNDYKTVVVPLIDNPGGNLSLSFIFIGEKGKELIRVDSFRVLKAQ